MNKVYFFSLTLYLCHATSLQAKGSEGRNGGNGVIVGNQLVPWDLIANDTYKNPHINHKDLPVSEQINQDVDSMLNELLKDSAFENEKQFITLLTTTKIAYLKALLKQWSLEYPVDEILDNARQFSWVRNNVKCLDIHDEDELGHDKNKKFPSRFQLAYRERDFIRFCNDAFRVSKVYFVALVLHELFYSGQREKSLLPDLINFLFDTRVRLDDSASQKKFVQIIETLNLEVSGNIKMKRGEKIIPKLGRYQPEQAANVDAPGHVIWKLVEDDYGEIDKIYVTYNFSKENPMSTIFMFTCDHDLICRHYDEGGSIRMIIRIYSDTVFEDLTDPKQSVTFKFFQDLEKLRRH